MLSSAQIINTHQEQIFVIIDLTKTTTNNEIYSWDITYYFSGVLKASDQRVEIALTEI